MKKTLFLILLLLIPLASAQSIEVQVVDKGSTIISELLNPAVFDLIIDNKGKEESFQIYSLTVPITPSSRINLESGKKTIEIRATPGEHFRNNLGFFSFEYEIKRQSGEVYRDTLQLKIIYLEEVFEFTAKPINKDSGMAKIIITNKQNTNINNIEFELESQFFTATEKLSFEPNEEVEIEVELNKDFSKLKAGPYIFEAKVGTVEKDGIIEYLENEETFFNKETSGFFVRTTTIEKMNLGNTELTETLTINKDVVSRLFTINSPSADKVERKGFSTIYTWEKPLEPGESITVKSTTNYTFPFIILLALILIGFTAKSYFANPVKLSKKVSLVKTKGGEFALKVNLRVKAKSNLEKVHLIDSLPAMTKLYEKFGKKPDEINEKSRTLIWKLNSMSKGEEQLFSYIIYSKLKIIGRFELPTARVSFEKEGEQSQVNSNHAFFAEEISY